MQDQFYQTPFQKRSRAADFRSSARTALAGRWGLAIGVFLLASLLGMSLGVSFPEDSSLTVESEADLLGLLDKLRLAEKHLIENGVMDAAKYVIGSVIGLDVVLAWGTGVIASILIGLFVGAPVTVGYHRFLLDFADRRSDVGVKTLFSAFSTCYWRSICLKLLLGVLYCGVGVVTAAVLFVILTLAGILGSLLLVLAALAVIFAGGVLLLILEIRLALCHYIMAEYPDLSAMDVIRNSNQLMKGNSWRYFCLQISFFGWMLATVCTCGVGMVALSPYMFAANTAFYSEISGRDTAKEVEFPSIDPDDYFPSI